VCGTLTRLWGPSVPLYHCRGWAEGGCDGRGSQCASRYRGLSGAREEREQELCAYGAQL